MLYHYLFEPGFSSTSSQYTRGLSDAEGLGYTLYVPAASVTVTGSSLHAEVTIRNTGTAPFYYPWGVELGVKTASGITTFSTSWDLRAVVPGATDTVWSQDVQVGVVPAGSYPLLLRVVNPLAGGLPLQFANATQDADEKGWLTLGQVQLGY
jgi:hypothetical protein